MDRHCNSSLMTLKITVEYIHSVWGCIFFSVTQRCSSPALHRCARAFPCRGAPAVHVCIGLLSAASSSGLFPPCANASNCTKRRKGEKLTQVFCIKPGLGGSQGWARLHSDHTEACQSVDRFQEEGPPAPCPAFQLALWDPHPESHPISACQLTCCTMSHGRDCGGDS